MAYRVSIFVCPHCGWGRDTLDGIDMRKAFLKNGKVLLMCPYCGWPFLLKDDLRCRHKNCNKPATCLMVMNSVSFDEADIYGFCEVSSSNKRESTACECGQVFGKPFHWFGPNTLEPIGSGDEKMLSSMEEATLLRKICQGPKDIA